MKRRSRLVFLLSGILLMTTACADQEEKDPQTAIVQEEDGSGYITTTVEYGEVISSTKVSARYTPMETQDIRFPADGYLIQQVNVKLGDYVTKGQLLVSAEVQGLKDKIEEKKKEIESLELRKRQTEELRDFDLESAQIMYTYTKQKDQDKKNLKKQQDKIEKQYKNTLEDIEDNLSLERSRIKEYEEEWAMGRLTAGISGEITFCTEELVNTFSNSKDTILVISDRDSSYFVSGDTEYASYFTEGTPVELTYRVPGSEESCQVLPARMDEWGEKMYFKLADESIVPVNTGGSISLELGRKERVLCVAKAAVHQSDKGSFVYTVRDGLLEMRYVKVGLVGESLVEITEGLEQGETVILNK